LIDGENNKPEMGLNIFRDLSFYRTLFFLVNQVAKCCFGGMCGEVDFPLSQKRIARFVQQRSTNILPKDTAVLFS
jgi:hypothetical protein